MQTTILETIETDLALTPEEILAKNGKSYITFEEFIALGETEPRYEWVDGELEEPASCSYFHEDLFLFLAMILRGYVKKHKLGVIIGSDFAMRVTTIRRGREPDLIFVAEARRHLFSKTYLDGAPDLAIEIISNESQFRDRVTKFNEYEIAGIREYWLISPEEKQAEFYRLNENGKYETVEIGENGVFNSEVITDFWLKVDWLWALPDELDILRELKVI